MSHKQIDIYTDGSMFPKAGIIGWAYVVEKDRCLIHADSGESKYTQKNASVYAELYAIQEAVLYINKNLKMNKYTIFTDLKAAVVTLNSGHDAWTINQGLMYSMYSDIMGLMNAQGMDISVKFIRSHSISNPNKFADRFAKDKAMPIKMKKAKITKQNERNRLKNLKKKGK